MAYDPFDIYITILDGSGQTVDLKKAEETAYRMPTAIVVKMMHIREPGKASDGFCINRLPILVNLEP